MRKVLLAVLLTVFIAFTGLTLWMQFNPEMQPQISETSDSEKPTAPANVAGTTPENLDPGDNVDKPSLWQRVVALFRGSDKPVNKGYGFKYGECARWGVANKCKVKD